MSTELCFGSVPAFYREVYDIVCPNQEQVDRDLFVQLLVRSSLPKSTAMQIWDAVDTSNNLMTRNGLYKALALTALAQQGNTINDNLLDSFAGQELPTPNLGDLSDMKATSCRIRRERAPNVLGLSFADLCSLDSVKLELVPEKRGLILKHVEYEVTSRRFNSTVYRRFNDFIVLHDMITMCFPYRIVPRLPPKNMLRATREFIDGRKKALKRFITILVRHPQIYDDLLLKFFLTYNGNEMQHKMREQFRGMPDEFMTSNMASKARDLVPLDTQVQLSNSKSHIHMLTDSVTKMKGIVERMVIRSTSFATDILMFGRQLSAMSSDATPLTAWSTGTSSMWQQLQKGFRRLSVQSTALSDKSTQAAVDLEDGVVETMSLFRDVLIGFQDLCFRHEKGVLAEHQRAIQKMGQYKKKRMSATVQSGANEGTLEQLEQRILLQEGQIANMENRNYYSLHCLQMETQLVYAHLDIFHHVLSRMVEVEGDYNFQLAKVWASLKPIVDSMVPSCSSPSSLMRSSPIGSPDNRHNGICL